MVSRRVWEQSSISADENGRSGPGTPVRDRPYPLDRGLASDIKKGHLFRYVLCKNFAPNQGCKNLAKWSQFTHDVI